MTKIVATKLIAVLVGLVLAAAMVNSKAIRHLKVHTLIPPILDNYWDNGLHEWSFGAGTVVTDQYARIAPKSATSRGYLWNRRSVEVDNFQFNATFRLKDREGKWFSDKSGSGLAFWLTSQTPRHVPVSFYGMTDQFTGLGVVFDHTDHVQLLFNNGQALNSPHDAEVGTCKISIGEQWATFILRVSKVDQIVDVLVSVGGGAPQPCSRVRNIQLPPQIYLGITAQNTETSQAHMDATMLTVYPMGKPEDLAEDQMPHYKHDVTKHEQDKWTGQSDKEDLGDDSIGAGENERQGSNIDNGEPPRYNQPPRYGGDQHHNGGAHYQYGGDGENNNEN